ncbi:glycosyltransferase [Paenibacillus sp. N1-5-1-14]|uniref:glycosyltransferase family 2 protein n=1 Tax=Paenibacillus radicibacter TaxID=2972488 RepID=UPI002158AC7F|nr:glycosyltransferase [Paenibacillus radicibacter]MCR8645182.1 glycosyltransferase [Paenibacillus radicibacter]
MKIMRDKGWQWGFRKGNLDANMIIELAAPIQIQTIQAMWVEQVQNAQLLSKGQSYYMLAMKGYLKAIQEKTGYPIGELLLPTLESVGVVVSCYNNESTLTPILAELRRIPFTETICIVSNQSCDHTLSIACGAVEKTYLCRDEPNTHEVCRAMGASIAQADLMLFIDGGTIKSAEELLVYINQAKRGDDIVLPASTEENVLFENRSPVSVIQQFYNECLGQIELGTHTLMQVPYVISRSAYEVIGCEQLKNPAQAMAIASMSGLRIGTISSKSKKSKSKWVPPLMRNTQELSHEERSMYLSGLQSLIHLWGPRLHYHDGIRDRSIVAGETMHVAD